MKKNIILLTFLGLFLVACGEGAGGGASQDGAKSGSNEKAIQDSRTEQTKKPQPLPTPAPPIPAPPIPAPPIPAPPIPAPTVAPTLDCSNPANKGRSACPYQSKDEAEEHGSFVYEENGKTQSILDNLLENGASTEEKANTLLNDNIVKFVPLPLYSSLVYFSQKNDNLFTFKDALPVNLDIADIPSGVSETYVGGDYVAFRTFYNPNAFYFFKIEYSHFLIPQKDFPSLAFFNRHNRTANVFEKADIKADYSGKAWGFTGKEYADKVTGSFTLTVDTNEPTNNTNNSQLVIEFPINANGVNQDGEKTLIPAPKDSKMGETAVKHYIRGGFTKVTISNLDFSKDKAFTDGFFQNKDLKIDGNKVDSGTIATFNGLPFGVSAGCGSKGVDTLTSNTSCASHLYIAFAGEGASHVGGQLTYKHSFNHESSIFFAGQKNPPE